MKPHEAFEFVPCHEAAAEIKANLGFATLAPVLGGLVQQLESCTNPECPGTPRMLIMQHVVESLVTDRVLAVRN